MPQTPELDVFQKEMTELKADHKTLEQRVTTLERSSERHDQQIISINEKLNKIEENTTWIKRALRARSSRRSAPASSAEPSPFFITFCRNRRKTQYEKL